MTSTLLDSEKTGLRASIGRFFYADEVPYGLALVRMFVPIGILAAMVPRWSRAREWFSTDGASSPLWDSYGWHNMLPEPSGVIAVAILTLLLFTLVTTCIGWCTRFSAVFAFVAYTYLCLLDGVSTMTKYSVIASHVLLLLSLSECGAVWSVDAWLKRRRERAAGLPVSSPLKSAAWPRRLMQFMIGVVYFGSAITKFHTPAYFTGDQMVTWMQTNVNFPNPIGEWMSQYTVLIIAISYVAIVWEIMFVFLCWRGVGRWAMLGLGVMFHVSTFVMLGLIVFPMICIPIYLAFLNEADIQAISLRMRRWKLRFGFSSSPDNTPVVPTQQQPAGGFAVPSLVVFAGAAVIVASLGIEIEHWMDPYGLRRPEGAYALKEVDPELVEGTYFRRSGMVRPVDTIASFRAGTIMIGNELLNPGKEFRIGETVNVQTVISSPHDDMILECSLHDAQDSIVDSVPHQLARRESNRCRFQFRLSDSLEPGEYEFVLKRAGRELLRHRITIRGRKNSVVAQ